MDFVLEVFDTFIFDYAYAAFLPLGESGTAGNATLVNATANVWQYRPATAALTLKPSTYAWLSQWPRDNIYRQSLSLFTIAWVFGLLTYFLFASLSYVFLFNKEDAFNHPKYLKNQMTMEMKTAASAIPVMGALTVPVFLAEVRGYTKLFDAWSDAPFPLYNILQYPFFIAFTDCCIYFIHRGLHYPPVYKVLHKPHHKWIVPTPFASHAFHPLDGLAQSLPYHVFPFLFPLQKLAYVALFVAVNFWTIFIHDGDYVANNPIINGAACHTMHHLYFNYNYGQYTTLWDRLGGSYRYPIPEKKYPPKEFNGNALRSDGIVSSKSKIS